ncbi:MAG: hypothetical protein SF070_16270 [Gemmatimonadota bacterium]|nr:hypothetical protein [Gemmatimonadota bacterium]
MNDSQPTDVSLAAFTAVPVAAAALALGVVLLFGGLLGFLFGAYGLEVTRVIVLSSCAVSSSAALLYRRAERRKPSTNPMDPSGLGR